jgi:hypothetical protein
MGANKMVGKKALKAEFKIETDSNGISRCNISELDDVELTKIIQSSSLSFDWTVDFKYQITGKEENNTIKVLRFLVGNLGLNIYASSDYCNQIADWIKDLVKESPNKKRQIFIWELTEDLPGTLGIYIKRYKDFKDIFNRTKSFAEKNACTFEVKITTKNAANTNKHWLNKTYTFVKNE